MNLDLSVHHGPVKPPRQRTSSARSKSKSRSRSRSRSSSGSTDGNGSRSRSNSNSNHAGNKNTTTTTTTTNNANADSPYDQDHIQILGLHTSNPIISYRDHLFSCYWADLLGTELFLSLKDEDEHGNVLIHEPTATTTTTAADSLHPLKRGNGFDLISANNVKIIGRRAHLISASGDSSQSHSAHTKNDNPQSQPSTTATPVTNQAQFIQELSRIKQAKGETDTVRTTLNVKRPQNIEERLRGWARTEEQMADIHRLSARAQNDDRDAQGELKDLYEQLGVGVSDKG